jgi:hypothetical protein
LKEPATDTVTGEVILFRLKLATLRKKAYSQPTVRVHAIPWWARSRTITAVPRIIAAHRLIGRESHAFMRPVTSPNMAAIASIWTSAKGDI